MKRALVTGAAGFIGTHLVRALSHRGVEVMEYTRSNSWEHLKSFLDRADVVFHLAGVNRPEYVEGYAENYEFTRQICEQLRALNRKPLIIFASSTQAGEDNPYGRSKLEAEGVLEGWVKDTGGSVRVCRLPGVFGPGCRPHYNSVVATFCHDIAHGVPVKISDPEQWVNLMFVEDAVSLLINSAKNCLTGFDFDYVTEPIAYLETLESLAYFILEFHDSNQTLLPPGGDFNTLLYGTYLSYVDPADLVYDLPTKPDFRGTLVECLKPPPFSQLFVSTTLPGIVRGNHYHNHKVEKFFVLSGKALIRLRPINSTDVTEIRVSGERFQGINIPPGFVHSIENTGDSNLITLFWSSEVFDPNSPDTLEAKP